MKLISCPTCGESNLIEENGKYHCRVCRAIFSEKEKENIEELLEKARESGLTADLGKLRYLLKEELRSEFIAPLDVIRRCDDILRILPDDPVASLLRAFFRRKSHRKDYHASLSEKTDLIPYQKEILYPFLVDLCEHADAPAVRSFLLEHGDEASLPRVDAALRQRMAEEDLFANVPRDVFVCHKHEDLERIKPLLDELENDGFTLWYSERNLPKDVDNYKSNIEKAIASCGVFLVFASTLSMHSEDVKWELDVADELKKASRLEYRLEDVKNTIRLRHFFDGLQWIDGACGDDYDSLSERIYDLLHPKKEEIGKEAEEEARKAKEEAERKAKEEAARKAEEEAERKAKEEAARKAEEEAKRKADEEGKARQKEAEARREAEKEANGKSLKPRIEGDLVIYGEYPQSPADPSLSRLLDSKEAVASVSGVLENDAGSASANEEFGIDAHNDPADFEIKGRILLKYKGKDRSVRIPNRVTSIADWAFYANKSLVEAYVPDSVKSIGKWAFQNCPSLERIRLSKSLETLDSYAFKGCSSLRSISIPASVRSIGQYILSDCPSLQKIAVDPKNPKYDSRGDCNAIIFTSTATMLDACSETTFPSGIKAIGNGAFYGCDSIESVKLPDSVTSLTSDAFSRCGLKSILIPASVTDIGEGILVDCPSLSKIAVDPKNLKYDSRGDCNAIIEKSKSVLVKGCDNTIIPDGTKAIGNWAFLRCGKIRSIVIPNGVRSIGEYAFGHCSSLSSAILPETLESIGELAFVSCDALASIAFPRSLIEIGKCAFQECASLASIEIPETVKSIGPFAFRGCRGTLIIHRKKPQDGYPDGFANDFLDGFKGEVIWDEKPLFAIVGAKKENEPEPTTQSPSKHRSVPDHLALPTSAIRNNPADFEVENGVLKKYKGREEIVSIPNGIASIGEFAFCGSRKLTEVIIPDSVRSIGRFAFRDCPSLKAVRIPKSVTSLGGGGFTANVFEWCPALSSIVVDPGNPKYDSRDGCNAIIDTSANALIVGCRNTVILPSITHIGSSAFLGCSGISSIEIPASVTSIDSQAFECCESLTSIRIPSSVKSIGTGVFRMCSSLEAISVDPSNPKYDSREGCNAIIETSSNRMMEACKNTFIPFSVVEIANSCFAGRSSIEDLAIPSSVAKIEAVAFEKCRGLRRLVIPKSVAEIGRAAFSDCVCELCIQQKKPLFGYPKGFDKEFLKYFKGKIYWGDKAPGK